MLFNAKKNARSSFFFKEVKIDLAAASAGLDAVTAPGIAASHFALDEAP